jgi:hypothetical protein
MGGSKWKKKCVEEVDGLYGEEAYKDRNRKREQDFTRNRKMPFKQII